MVRDINMENKTCYEKCVNAGVNIGAFYDNCPCHSIKPSEMKQGYAGEFGGYVLDGKVYPPDSNDWEQVKASYIMGYEKGKAEARTHFKEVVIEMMNDKSRFCNCKNVSCPYNQALNDILQEIDKEKK